MEEGGKKERVAYCVKGLNCHKGMRGEEKKACEMGFQGHHLNRSRATRGKKSIGVEPIHLKIVCILSLCGVPERTTKGAAGGIGKKKKGGGRPQRMQIIMSFNSWKKLGKANSRPFAWGKILGRGGLGGIWIRC